MSMHSAPAASVDTLGPGVLVRLVAKCFLYGVVCLVLAGIAGTLTGFLVYDYVTRPGSPGELVPVTIPEGASGKAVSVILEDKGLVEYAIFFRIALRLDNSSKFIKHGYFELPRGLSPMQLLACIQQGPEAPRGPGSLEGVVKLTIPEGLTIAQLARLFDHPDAFMEAASDPERIGRFGAGASTLEGFLMPNTYYFDEEPSEQVVVERMVGQFETEYGALLAELPHAAKRDRLEVVTVASLVEEEARVDAERQLIAAVIYNRLKRQMPLELDSTLQYALGKYGQRMLDKDKQVPSPYNTYIHTGLPPGPISNPGVASLRAAVEPADVDYMYFVSKADGKTHTFSRTFAEHSRAVARYRRAVAAQRSRTKQHTRNAEDSQ